MTSGFEPGSGSFDDFIARFFGARPGDARTSVYRVDISRLLTEATRSIIAAAARRAMEDGGSDLGAEHLLWACTQVPGLARLLSAAGADPDSLARECVAAPSNGTPSEVPPVLTPAAKRALLDAHQLARSLGAGYIGPDHLLLALAANEESPAGRVLRQHRITPQTLQRAASGEGIPRQRAAGERGPSGGPGDRSTTPTLDSFSVDLTGMARAGRLDPVIGRDDEIEQTIEVLSRRTKNNPVLIGEAGVGKTAIVEGIAQRVVDGDVPDTLGGRRVVQLQLSGMVAGTRYRGDFEERITTVIEEIRARPDELIVFIDELHTVVGAGTGGEGGGMDAGNILKPALARGELHVIGATTLDEYRANLERDPALERRFQPILVPEPSVEDTVRILCGLHDRYEAHHQVRYTDDAVRAAAELSDRYVTDRFLPDKAVDLLDQAGARVRLRTRTPPLDVRDLEQRLDQLERDKAAAVAGEEYERAVTLRDEIDELARRIGAARDRRGDGVPKVGVDDIAGVVARSTGIPVTQLTEDERTRLVRLEDVLHERVIGQDEAVRMVAEAVRRSRAGIAEESRPIGSFLFLGPTGVGKTELAKALAHTLFGDEDRMIRLDMSEYAERHTASRLFGAPPGYVGYDQAGQLTEQIRRRPYSVVLLDEMEKAHPDIFNTLLQVLDDGRLTDGQGRTVDFRNTVVIMTSNVGSEALSSTARLGFGTGSGETDDESVRASVMGRLREVFRPEFLNRVDEIVVFRRLDSDQLRAITDLLLAETLRRVERLGIRLNIEPDAVDWLAERGYQPEYGARPLRRAIQREVGNRISDMLLDGRLARGDRLTIALRDGELSFDRAGVAAASR